jgi:zinc transport system substrate-binding protein
MRYTITLLLTSLLAATAHADVPRVVTDIPPVQALVAQVMGDLGTPDLLLEKGASEHTYQMKPSQAAVLADAGLVVWIGPELTPWLGRALESVPVSVPRLGLFDLSGTVTQPYQNGMEEEHVEGTDPAHDGLDPHIWLDPNNAQVWLIAIAGELAKLDPEHAATYTANAMAAVETVVKLDTDVRAILAPVQDKPIIVFHEAFGYFATHFGLTIAGSISEGDASAPGAARLSEIRAMIADGKVTCVFPETNHDPKLVQQMVDGTDARIGAPLDPVGTSLNPGPSAYDALLRGMATAIAECVAG